MHVKGTSNIYRTAAIKVATRRTFLGDVSVAQRLLGTSKAAFKCASCGPSERVLVVICAERMEARCLAFARLFVRGTCAEMHIMKPSSADPAEEVRDMAIALEADWLCMVSHTRPGVMSLFLTSDDERMLRIAPCPVICIPDSLRSGRKVESYAGDLSRIQRILIPLNSSGNRHVMTHAIRLADRFGAKIDLLGVEESISRASGALALNFKRMRRARQLVVGSELAALADKVVPKHQRGRKSVSIGFPTFYATIRAMRDFKTDLIGLPVPSRLWQARSRIDVGTERILHEASCPVICFPEPENHMGADLHSDKSFNEQAPKKPLVSRG